VSDDQLERWRGAGLMPPAIQTPRYKPNGKVDGSEVWLSASAARQAVAIERILHHFRSLDRVGAILWAAGFEVDERYWRPAIRKGARHGRLIADVIRRLYKSDDLGPTIGETCAKSAKFRGILHGVKRKAGEAFPLVLDTSIAVAAGDFAGFQLSSSERDEPEETGINRALGFDGGKSDHVHGQSLGLEADLASLLTAMSQSGSDAAFTDAEIFSARDDLGNALKIAWCLYDATAWIYGRQSFGLQLAHRVGSLLAVGYIQAFTIGFARLRRHSDTLLSSAEIADLAVEAERLWMMSMWFKDIAEGDGENAGTLSAKRLKSALTDSASYQNLLGELASREFAKSEFRPWDQWRKSAGKTMSPGLLVMSIGSPKVIAFDDLVGSTNGAAIL
jgi:hypothetical protein